MRKNTSQTMTQATHKVRRIVAPRFKEIFDKPSLGMFAPMFSEVADDLANALANVYQHVNCPPYIRARIEEFHKAVVSEFNVEPEADIRLRFSLAAQLSAEGQRPA